MRVKVNVKLHSASVIWCISKSNWIFNEEKSIGFDCIHQELIGSEKVIVIQYQNGVGLNVSYLHKMILV